MCCDGMGRHDWSDSGMALESLEPGRVNGTPDSR